MLKTLGRRDNSIASEPVVHVVLQAEGEGHARKAVSQFSARFTFTDNGLGLSFTDEGSLQQFFNETRELYPGLFHRCNIYSPKLRS